MRHPFHTVLAALVFVLTPGHAAEVVTEAVVAKAQSGDAAAQYIVASALLDKNNKSVEAFDWLLVAAQNGNSEAQYRMANQLIDSRGKNEEDPHACDLDPFCLRNCYASKERQCGLYQSQKMEEYWLTQAATLGHLKSQLKLAEMYDDGQSAVDALSKKDHELAELLWRPYPSVSEIARDAKKAYYWYTVAAASGDIEAMEKVGLMSYYGVGTIQDYQYAVGVIARAAIAGNAYSQIRLAAIYEKGVVVPPSAVLAYAWANVAAAGGEEAIMKERDRIASALTMDQMTKGQAISRQWVVGQGMAE